MSGIGAGKYRGARRFASRRNGRVLRIYFARALDRCLVPDYIRDEGRERELECYISCYYCWYLPRSHWWSCWFTMCCASWCIPKLRKLPQIANNWKKDLNGPVVPRRARGLKLLNSQKTANLFWSVDRDSWAPGVFLPHSRLSTTFWKRHWFRFGFIVY